MNVEQLMTALEVADIGYGSNGYVSTALEGEICIDGTYDITRLLAALSDLRPEAAREITPPAPPPQTPA